MPKGLGGNIGCRDKKLLRVSKGFPNVTTSGQQYNTEEKPSVILYVQLTSSRVIDKMVVDEGRALQPCRYRWCTHSLVLFSTHTAHNRAVGTHT